MNSSSTCQIGGFGYQLSCAVIAGDIGSLETDPSRRSKYRKLINLLKPRVGVIFICNSTNPVDLFQCVQDCIQPHDFNVNWVLLMDEFQIQSATVWDEIKAVFGASPDNDKISISNLDEAIQLLNHPTSANPAETACCTPPSGIAATLGASTGQAQAFAAQG